MVIGEMRDGVDVQRSVYEDGLCIIMYNVCLVCDNVQDASLPALATSRANSSDSEAPSTRIGIFDSREDGVPVHAGFYHVDYLLSMTGRPP